MEEDKAYHLYAGMIIGILLTLAYAITHNYTKVASPFIVFLPLLAATVAGFLKELYDVHVKKTFFDKMDLCMTAVGGAIVTILNLLIFKVSW